MDASPSTLQRAAQRAPELAALVILAGMFLWFMDKTNGRIVDSLDRNTEAVQELRQAVELIAPRIVVKK